MLLRVLSISPRGSAGLQELEIPFLGVFMEKDSDGIPTATVEVCASTCKPMAVVHCMIAS